MQLFAGELTNQNREYYKVNDIIYYFIQVLTLLLRLPVGRGRVINSPRSIFLFSVSEVGLPLMGDTAGTKLHEPI